MNSITPYPPPSNSQFVPKTATSAKDCVPASFAMLAERATVSAIRITHKEVRTASKAPADRGLYLYEGVAGVKVATKGRVIVTLSLGVSRNTTRDTVAGGHAAAVTIWTGETRYAAGGARRTGTFIGPHEIVLLSYSDWPAGEVCACELKTATRHGEFNVYDPGWSTIAARQWSANLVYRAAEKLTAVYGMTGIQLAVAEDTEGRSWKAVKAYTIRSTPTYSGSKVVGRIVIGRAYPGGRTQKGGAYPRDWDGKSGYGWVHIRYTSTRWGWVIGEGVVQA